MHQTLVALLLKSSKQATSVDSLLQDIINDAEYLLKSQTTFGTRRLRAYSYIPSTFSHLPTIFRFLFRLKVPTNQLGQNVKILYFEISSLMNWIFFLL